VTARSEDPEVAEALRLLGASDPSEESIYPYAPVFRASVDGRPVVVKRARRSTPEAIATWTRSLAANAFPVVTPVVEPVRDSSGAAWVAYPWIEGRPYRCTTEDIAAAGDLLGRLHAWDAPPSGIPSFGWPQYAAGDVEADLAKCAPLVSGPLRERLRELAARLEPELLPPLRDADLPRFEASADWKANNLVYAPSGPVLVDPDNGEYLPRLLDLALAVVLFHTETATHRAFDAAEWAAFRAAYLAHVRLTDVERELWPVALEYQQWEEGSWAVEDSDWSDPDRALFLADALCADATRFPL
jgi:Ser/Thr protein kinase RdoA (MazF antagonist)